MKAIGKTKGLISGARLGVLGLITLGPFLNSTFIALISSGAECYAEESQPTPEPSDSAEIKDSSNAQAEGDTEGDAPAEEEEEEEEESPTPEDNEPLKSQKVISIKGVPAKEFRFMCEAIAKDGRLESFYYMLNSEGYDPVQCPACKGLIRMLARACKPKSDSQPKARGKAKETPAPTETAAEEGAPEQSGEEIKPKSVIKQREPSAVVTDLVSSCFSQLSEAPAARLFAVAVQYLTEVLESSEGKSVAEREYFAAIAYRIRYPFIPIFDQIKQEEQQDQ